MKHGFEKVNNGFDLLYHYLLGDSRIRTLSLDGKIRMSKGPINISGHRIPLKVEIGRYNFIALISECLLKIYSSATQLSIVYFSVPF